jgi:thermitase
MNLNLKTLPLLTALGFGFSACTNLTTEVSSLQRYAYTLTVDLQSSDTKTSLEAKYSAPVIIFDQQAGYAVLGFRDSQVEAGKLRLQAAGALQANAVVKADQVTKPDGSLGLWADGSLGLWADGSLGLWADGSLGLWADGSLGLWADGVFAPIPANTDNWKSIRLQEGQSRAPNLGKSVKIAVIDSGIDLSHPAFKRSLVASSEMRDFVDGDSVPNDTINGHGTAVAAIALQIAPGAMILPLRVIGSDGTGDADKLAQAINYAVSSGAQVINISLSVAGVSDPVRLAIQAAGDKKIPVFLSAGNLNGALNFPATLAVGPLSVVSVGSVNAAGLKSSFSNYGINLELSAPGEGIVTAFPGNRKVAASGTSMSTAVASGATALALGETKRLTSTTDYAARQTWMTADSSIYKLSGNKSFAFAVPTSLGYYGTLGFKGRLNLENYLKTVLK